MYHECINPLGIERFGDDSYVRLRSEFPQLSTPERYETTPETRPNAPLKTAGRQFDSDTRLREQPRLPGSAAVRGASFRYRVRVNLLMRGALDAARPGPDVCRCGVARPCSGPKSALPAAGLFDCRSRSGREMFPKIAPCQVRARDADSRRREVVSRTRD